MFCNSVVGLVGSTPAGELVKKTVLPTLVTIAFAFSMVFNLTARAQERPSSGDSGGDDDAGGYCDGTACYILVNRPPSSGMPSAGEGPVWAVGEVLPGPGDSTEPGVEPQSSMGPGPAGLLGSLGGLFGGGRHPAGRYTTIASEVPPTPSTPPGLLRLPSIQPRPSISGFLK